MHITPCCNLPINTPHLNFFVSRKKRYTRSCIPRFEKRKMEKKCIKQCRVLLRGLSSSNSLSLHCSLISCPDFLIVAMSSRLLFSLLTTRQQKNLTKIPSISPVFFQVFILCIEIKTSLLLPFELRLTTFGIRCPFTAPPHLVFLYAFFLYKLKS